MRILMVNLAVGHGLWFSGISILLAKPDSGRQFPSMCQICANVFKNGRIIAD